MSNEYVNIYMTTSWCKYWEEGMNWPQLYYAFMKPLVAGIICMIKHEHDKTSDSKTLHFVDLQKNKLEHTNLVSCFWGDWVLEPSGD